MAYCVMRCLSFDLIIHYLLKILTPFFSINTWFTVRNPLRENQSVDGNEVMNKIRNFFYLRDDVHLLMLTGLLD